MQAQPFEGKDWGSNLPAPTSPLALQLERSRAFAFSPHRSRPLSINPSNDRTAERRPAYRKAMGAA